MRWAHKLIAKVCGRIRKLGTFDLRILHVKNCGVCISVGVKVKKMSMVERSPGTKSNKGLEMPKHAQTVSSEGNISLLSSNAIFLAAILLHFCFKA